MPFNDTKFPRPLNSVGVKTQKLLAPLEACNVSSQRNNQTHYDEAKKRAHDSQIVLATEKKTQTEYARASSDLTDFNTLNKL